MEDPKSAAAKPASPSPAEPSPIRDVSSDPTPIGSDPLPFTATPKSSPPNRFGDVDRYEPSFRAKAETWIRQNETVAVIGAFAVGVIIGVRLRR